jgi:predicted PurR-regulated permease PerM
VSGAVAPGVRAGAVDLHPIVVTVAFLMGAQMAGAIGALVSIPIAAILTSFFTFYFDRYRTAHGWTEVDTQPGGAATEPAPIPVEVTP